MDATPEPADAWETLDEVDANVEPEVLDADEVALPWASWPSRWTPAEVEVHEREMARRAREPDPDR